jgi:hypothetical protein
VRRFEPQEPSAIRREAMAVGERRLPSGSQVVVSIQRLLGTGKEIELSGGGIMVIPTPDNQISVRQPGIALCKPPSCGRYDTPGNRQEGRRLGRKHRQNRQTD